MRTSAETVRKTDLHPFHFQGVLPLGGDQDAAFTAREIVDWVERFGVFTRFVLGSHPPGFFRIKTKLSPEEYLDGLKSYIEGVRPHFSGRIFRGIECDLRIERGGKFSFTPGEALLSRFDPEVPLIALHFHSSLTYAGLFELEIGDLVGALNWAIQSGRFAILGHPFDLLDRIWKESPASFEQLANLARERKVAFEINADKGFVAPVLERLVANGNLFSFGGDLHSFSHWLKREPRGLKVPLIKRQLVGRVLGLTREAADFEKDFWREMDRLIWHLPYPSVRRWVVRDRAINLYRSCPSAEAFDCQLQDLILVFSPADRRWVESGLRKLNRIYRRWGGEIRPEERRQAEKCFLTAPLTVHERAVYVRYLKAAKDLGLKEEQLINSWETSELEQFFSR